MDWTTVTRSMLCPICGEECRVKNTRSSAVIDNALYRRRACVACGYRFSTIEVAVPKEACPVIKLFASEVHNKAIERYLKEGKG